MTCSERTSSQGFTLIELLVVIAIVAILASISISQYSLYKQKSVDSLMDGTLHEARQAMEAYYVGVHTYQGATESILTTSYGYRASGNVTLSITPPPTDSDYGLTVCAIGGTSPAFAYTSAAGLMSPNPGPCT
jgi:prepilin-type N-terminal cleavage/methylation domain-containing protein